MPRYRTTPPVMGIFVPDVGPFQADESGIFEIADVTPAIEAACTAVGVKLVAVEDQPPPPATPPADDPATIEGAATVTAAEGAETIAGADSIAGAAEPPPAKPKGKGKGAEAG